MRVGYWLTVDRHGLRPRDDNTLFCDYTEVLRYTTTVSLRGATRRDNPSCLEVCVRGMRFAYRVTVDRHGLRPRDDRVCEERLALTISLEVR